MHIKIKRYRNNPEVYCGRSIGFFNKTEKHEVERLIKFHGTEEYFCKACLNKFREQK